MVVYGDIPSSRIAFFVGAMPVQRLPQSNFLRMTDLACSPRKIETMGNGVILICEGLYWSMERVGSIFGCNAAEKRL
jgi:hypothetical protein